MKCPECQLALKAIDCKGVTIHECIRCNGKWFERGELKRVEVAQDAALRWIDFEPFGKGAPVQNAQAEAKICPECLKKMQSLKYTDSRIAIDKCGCCGGIWLGRGELVKIIRYLENLIDTKPAADLAKESLKAFLKIYASEEGLISEVKDFLVLLYLLQVRIAAAHPELAEVSRRIYQVTPFK